MQYSVELRAFIFRKKRYNTLRDFVQDPEYASILKEGIPKMKIETLKESKYKLETDLLNHQISDISNSLTNMDLL